MTGKKLLRNRRHMKMEPVESRFIEALLAAFTKGVVPRCEDGTSASAFLAAAVHCFPDRISKKFKSAKAGAFVRAKRPMTATEFGALAELEVAFRATCERDLELAPLTLKPATQSRFPADYRGRFDPDYAARGREKGHVALQLEARVDEKKEGIETSRSRAVEDRTSQNPRNRPRSGRDTGA